MITGLVVAAAAALMFVALCAAMKRGDLPCPVRPVPPRPAGPVAWKDPGPVDPNAPWRDPLAGGLLDGYALTHAELLAAVGVSRRYPEAYQHLLAEALRLEGPEHPGSAPDGPGHTTPADITTPHASWLDRSPQVAEAPEGATS